MAGTGNNGNGRRPGAIWRWLSSLVGPGRNGPASVRLTELDYLSQLKRGGGI